MLAVKQVKDPFQTYSTWSKMTLQDDPRWKWQGEAIVRGEEWIWARNSLSCIKAAEVDTTVGSHQASSGVALTSQPNKIHAVSLALTTYECVTSGIILLYFGVLACHIGNNESGFQRNDKNTVKNVHTNAYTFRHTNTHIYADKHTHTHSKVYYLYIHHLL